MVQRTRVKICGITRPQDALLAQDLGVDALGFVFVPASARYIQPEAALDIINQVSPFITCVALFLNEDAAEVNRVLQLIPGVVPQFHGQESAAYCEQFGRPYLKAVGVGGGMPEASELAAFSRAIGFLFDSNVPGQLGGSGHTFDWSVLTQDLQRPLILAGGLDADNVRKAVEQVKPYALDVSSGVEAEKGIKDENAMTAFMAAVREADARATQ